MERLFCSGSGNQCYFSFQTSLQGHRFLVYNRLELNLVRRRNEKKVEDKSGSMEQKSLYIITTEPQNVYAGKDIINSSFFYRILDDNNIKNLTSTATLGAFPSLIYL